MLYSSDGTKYAYYISEYIENETIFSKIKKGRTDVNSKFALRFLAGLIAGGTEATYDLPSYLLGKLILTF